MLERESRLQITELFWWPPWHPFVAAIPGWGPMIEDGNFRLTENSAILIPRQQDKVVEVVVHKVLVPRGWGYPVTCMTMEEPS